LGGAGAKKGVTAWRQVYRALEHSNAKNACLDRKVMAKFPKPIEDFANSFITLQEKRHEADYDPHRKFTKSEVKQDIATARQAILDYQKENMKDRRAFCVWVLLKKRR
jgi:hypothetical protein